MTSLRYKVVARGVRRLGHKEVFSMDTQRLLDWLGKHDQTHRSLPPKGFERRFLLEKRTIAGHSCYIIEPRGKARPGAPVILFLHGGGFVFEAWRAHWDAAAKMVERLGARLWFCNYPLLPGATLQSSSDMVLMTYAAMLEEHPAHDIRVVGDSAGAAQTLFLGHRISHGEGITGRSLSMPRMMAALSPGQSVVRDPSIRARMDAIVPVDAMLSTAILDTLNELMQLESLQAPYYACPLEGDFSAFPPLTVFCGTREIFLPQMDVFMAQIRNTGGQAELIIGEGMCHVWPYVPLAPECKAAFGLLLKKLSE
ncbi:MAG: alpha/beta hydrolase [Coriobacteriaceae bacterium]|jgi:acetyl esterase/lipase|nr:alpha/beta hydrolase [Coriobacteriaceae bacterium]